MYFTKIKPSNFMGENPTKEEILFMYQWLYNSNKRKGDTERCEELYEKILKIKKAKSINVYKIKNGIPMLAGAVAGEIPRVNHQVINGKRVLVPSSSEQLEVDELETMAENIQNMTEDIKHI